MANNIPDRVAVIMAGGSGERFWPLSRHIRPKQFLCLTSKTHTLLEQTIANIIPLIPGERIFLATGKHLIETIRKFITDIPPENILAEPMKRNTAGCLAFVAAQLLARYGTAGYDITMAVLPADHSIGQPDLFRRVVDTAMAIAEKENALITFGIKPDRPETGYGYLEIPQDAKSVHCLDEVVPVYPVLRFCEKPNHKTAEEYFASGSFFWNSGMFFWKLSTFLEELGHAAPEMAKAVEDMAEALVMRDDNLVTTIFESLDDISIDFALMEKAHRVLAIKTNFDWDDMGAWDSLDRSFPKDENGNVVIGDPVLIDVENSIVYNEPGMESLAVALIGVEGLAVITTADGILVVPKNRVQDIKRVVKVLKERNSKQL